MRAGNGGSDYRPAQSLSSVYKNSSPLELYTMTLARSESSLTRPHKPAPSAPFTAFFE